MQAVCLLFAGRRGLDDQSTRHSVLRIPEVSLRIKQAQAVLDDSRGDRAIDLTAFALESDPNFAADQSLRTLLAGIVQVGLYDRYIKYRARPQFMIGRSNGSSALKVCAGRQGFHDFIYQSEFFSENQNVKLLVDTDTQLVGSCLEEYGLYEWSHEQQEYIAGVTKSKEGAGIVDELNLRQMIQQCIHIGPYNNFRTKEFEKLGSQTVSAICSIELDPILNSFWRSA